MVVPSLGEERGTSPKRSKSLHNFTLPSLKWASQRRRNTAESSAGVSGCGDRPSPASESDESTVTQTRESEPERNQEANARGWETKNRTTVAKPPRINGGGMDDYGIAAVRQKLVLDLATAVQRMKDAMLRNDEEKEKEERKSLSPAVSVEAPVPTTPPAEVVKRWNLRTRRAEYNKTPVGAAGGRGKGLKIDENKAKYSSPAARTDGGGGNSGKTRRAMFFVELSKKEIGEDFAAIVGRPPPRKPSKRPRAIQKQLDALFPGLWLTEITTDSYKVPESPKILKVPSKTEKGKDA